MPHVDEGQLHAYLDRGPGDATASEWATFESHLGVCEDCQARLEEARRLRGRAQEILASAGPADIDVPAFETLVARAADGESGAADGGSGPADGGSAGSGGGAGDPTEPASAGSKPKRRGWHTGGIPMAWAATVMVAVGAGWMARQVTMSSAEFDSIAKRPAAEVQAEAAPRPGEFALSTEARQPMDSPESLDRLEAKVDDEVSGRRANEANLANNREISSDAAAGLADAAAPRTAGIVDQRAAARSTIVAEAEVAEAGAGERARRQVQKVADPSIGRDAIAQADADNLPAAQVRPLALGAVGRPPLPPDAVAADGHAALGCYALELEGRPVGGLSLPARVSLFAAASPAGEAPADEGLAAARGDYFRDAADGRLYEATLDGESGTTPSVWLPFGADSLLILIPDDAGFTELRFRLRDGELTGTALAVAPRTAGEDRAGEVRGHRIDCAAVD